jgi:Na+-transporting NADH:ubiquinone oxidoreductase subunit C
LHSATTAESPLRALSVAGGVCLVCSLVVATSVVWLRPLQLENELRERHGLVLSLVESLPDFAGDGVRLQPIVVELASGETDPRRSPADYEIREAAQDPALAEPIAGPHDLARIGSRPSHATAYLLRDGAELAGVVLPIYGRGYVSTLWGYLVLSADGERILGLRFFEHAETPGLGSEIQSPEWTASWQGKRLRDDAGELRLRVVRGRSDPVSPDHVFEVDGISGATRTGRSVENLIRFWVGPDGFAPLLERLKQSETAS